MQTVADGCRHESDYNHNRTSTMHDADKQRREYATHTAIQLGKEAKAGTKVKTSV